MKLDVFSHCTIDTLYIDDSEYAVPGGPGCYCSLTARALKFDVTLHTKFSHDFPLIDDFSKKKMDSSLINPNGVWQARSDGGLWDFQSPKEIKSQIEDSPNTLNFRPYHIEVTIVGKN